MRDWLADVFRWRCIVGSVLMGFALRDLLETWQIFAYLFGLILFIEGWVD